MVLAGKGGDPIRMQSHNCAVPNKENSPSNSCADEDKGDVYARQQEDSAEMARAENVAVAVATKAAAARAQMAPKQDFSVPEHIYDKNGKAFYTPGRFLGEGGFAKCYEVVADSSGVKYAVKAVLKETLTKTRQRHKLLQEIKIHQTLKHDHIVRLYRVFEDDRFVYIIMELCEKQTLMETLRSKGRLSDGEARVILLQLLAAVEYLHANRVIHRDLKLGNLFLKEGPNLKLGDFGLATLVYGEDDRKRTICGTPNYIAPEVLEGGERGHSYEVDIWSFGVIMYTLLIGHPPFQRKEIAETYRKIQMAHYEFPQEVPVANAARDLITRLLHADPQARPKVADIRGHEYFNPVVPVKRELVPRAARAGGDSGLIGSIQGHLRQVLENCTSSGHVLSRMEGPPFDYLVKWMDFSAKHGIGYLVSNGAVGFYYNDGTSLVLSASRQRGHYFQPDESNKQQLVRESFSTATPSASIRSKLEIMQKFEGFLFPRSPLAEATTPQASTPSLVFLVKYFRTGQATFFRLSHRVLQINFFDHCKLLFGEEGALMVFIDAERRCFHFPSDISRIQLSSNISSRLQYVCDFFASMLAK